MVFKRLCLYLNLLTADAEVPIPTIGIQPMFFKAPYDLPDRSTEYISPISFVFYKGISLELSVDYKYSYENSLEDISRNFIFRETEITLTRYVKKTNPLEVYTSGIHQPQIVDLPSTIEPLFGFSLHISQVPIKYDIGLLKRGSQLISLYINYEGALEAHNSIGQIEKLREFLGIGKPENSSNYGFQFSLVLKQKQKNVQTLNTNMFQIVFLTNHDIVLAFEVKLTDYHIVSDVEKKKKGCVIS